MQVHVLCSLQKTTTKHVQDLIDLDSKVLMEHVGPTVLHAKKTQIGMRLFLYQFV